MSQDMQFEEEFRDGPRPTSSYQAGYTNPHSYSVNVSGQPLLRNAQPSGQDNSIGARLALAIISLVLVFGMFLAAIFIAFFSYYRLSTFFSMIAIFIALVFSGVVLLINLIFNRKH